MLVLARRRDEKIIIGNNIEVVVVDIQPNKVKLGISAPKEVIVDREEISKLRNEGENVTNP